MLRKRKGSPYCGQITPMQAAKELDALLNRRQEEAEALEAKWKLEAHQENIGMQIRTRTLMTDAEIPPVNWPAEKEHQRAMLCPLSQLKPFFTGRKWERSNVLTLLLY